MKEPRNLTSTAWCKVACAVALAALALTPIALSQATKQPLAVATVVPPAFDTLKIIPVDGCPCGSYKPNDAAEKRYQESRQLTAAGKFEEALKAANDALAFDKGPIYRNQQAVALFNLGVARAGIVGDKKRLDEALRVWQQMSRGKSVACEMTFYANALCRLQRWDEALKVADRAIADCNVSADAKVAKSIALQYLGQAPDALRFADEAMKLDPKSVAALYQYASCCYDLAKYEDALRAVALAIGLDPADGQIRTLLAMVHLALKHPSEAQANAIQAVGMTSDPAFLMAAGGVLSELGQYQQAAAAYAKALQAGFDPAAMYARAVALNAAGNRPEAVKVLHELETQSAGYLNVQEWLKALGG